MLLWANIFVDSPPSLSLGVEAGEANAMSRPPRASAAPILGLRDCGIIAFDSAIMAVLLLVNFWMEYGWRGNSLEYARTFAFMLLAMLHLIQSFESRSLSESMFRRDLFSANPTLVWALLLSMAFLLLGCYCPGLNHVIELEPLEGTEWGVIFINLTIHIALVETRKFAVRRWDARQSAAKRLDEQQTQAAVEQHSVQSMDHDEATAGKNASVV
jgi:Ca2+-transporting ATPase